MDEQQKSKLEIIQNVNSNTLKYFNNQYMSNLEQIQNLKTELFEVNIKIDELYRTKNIYVFSSNTRRNIFTPTVNEPLNNERGKIIDIQIEGLKDVKITLAQKIKTLENSLLDLKTTLENLRHAESAIKYLQLQNDLDIQAFDDTNKPDEEDSLFFVEPATNNDINNQHGFNVLMLDAFDKSYITTILDKNIRDAIVSNNHKLEIISYLLNSDISRAKITLNDVLSSSNSVIDALDTVINSIYSDFDSTKTITQLVESIVDNNKTSDMSILVNSNIKCDIDTTKLHFLTINNLLNILNMLLQNIYQHANASSLSIEVFINERVVECNISDNGNGISPDYLSNSPWYSSLHKAHELLFLLNGELSVLGKPMEGTKARFFFPTHLNK